MTYTMNYLLSIVTDTSVACDYLALSVIESTMKCCEGFVTDLSFANADVKYNWMLYEFTILGERKTHWIKLEYNRTSNDMAIELNGVIMGEYYKMKGALEND
jgi:hypothetical protein